MPPLNWAAKLSPSACTRRSRRSSRSSSGSGPSKATRTRRGTRKPGTTPSRGFRELGRHAAEVGVLLSLEMYEDTYLGTADSSVQLVQDIGLSNVGLNPDIGNLIRLHRPIEDWREMVAKTMPYSNYWHMKNYIRDEDVARDSYVAMPAPMESGLINYREAFKVAIAERLPGHHLHRALRRRRPVRDGQQPGIPAPPRPAQEGRLRARQEPGGPGTAAAGRRRTRLFLNVPGVRFPAELNFRRRQPGFVPAAAFPGPSGPKSRPEPTRTDQPNSDSMRNHDPDLRQSR